nr:hypothetical protein [uncultured Bacteroides sp.]
MKCNITQTNSQQKKNKQLIKAKDAMHPGTETLNFLKLFARNYHVEPLMPEGLQGIILG